jgi:hypothetical protein
MSSGIEAMGLTEAIVYAIKQCPVNMQPHLYNNIVIIGGSSKFQNFKVTNFFKILILISCLDFWPIQNVLSLKYHAYGCFSFAMLLYQTLLNQDI